MNSPRSMNSPKPRLKNATNLKDLYKSPVSHRYATPEIDSNNNPSPAWRSLYKKRCFDEFKKSRAKLVNRFRDLNVTSNYNMAMLSFNLYTLPFFIL